MATAWRLWVFHARSVVHYLLDPARSSQVVADELAGIKQAILKCDRYSAYKKFARLHPRVVLAFCWAHQRRDFLELAHAYPACEPWALEWVDAIGELYRLNELSLQVLPDSAQRAVAQAALSEAVQRLADPRLNAPERKVLQSMAEHWSGLTVFVDAPWVPMDNNWAHAASGMSGIILKSALHRRARPARSGRGAQEFLRLGRPVVGTATMYSVLPTLGLWQINARAWLGAYLQACADNGNRAPADLAPFLPWAMDEARLAAMRAVPAGAGARA